MFYRLFVFAFFAVFLLSSCSNNGHSSDDPDSGDSDSDSDADADSDSDSDADEWCPELATSCGDPEALSSCGDAGLAEPRLIYPLSGKYVRDRRPQIIWDGASGVSQYRVEIALDRDFTQVVYRSADYEDYPGIADRYSHIVDCDLSCGVHFFRVVSVTSAECETGSPSFVWQMYVGMAPHDLDRDGTPDIMCWHIEPAQGEFSKDRAQGFAIFDLDEKAGQEITEDDLVLVAEYEFEHDKKIQTLAPHGIGDFNGDGAFDVSINVFFNDDSDYSGELVVFSNTNLQETNTLDDSVVRVKAGIAGYNRTYHSFSQSPFVFADVNGDGLSDFMVGESNANDVMVPGLGYILLGNESGFHGTTSEIAEEIVGASASGMTDMDGDGISDFVYSSLSGFEVSYGSSNMSGEIDLLLNRAIVDGFSSAMAWGDWLFGTEPFFNSHSFLLGDIDFDGYMEVGALIQATDTTTYCDETMGPLSTGAAFVLEDISGSFTSTLDAMIDYFYIADLPVEDMVDDTENIGWILPSGNIAGDFLSDLVLLTDVNNSSHSSYPGRYFSFLGKHQWNDYNLFSQADDVEPSMGDEISYVYYLADIDGDGFSEVWGFDSSYSGAILHLSSTAQDVRIPANIIQSCSNNAGLLLPEQLY